MGIRAQVIAAVVAALAVAGCDHSTGGETTATKVTAPSTSATTPTTGAAATVEAPRGDGTPQAAPSTSTTELNVGNGLPIKATLASDCIKPGEKQSITIDIGHQGGVGYNSYYSDGKTAGMDNFYGGNNAGNTDDKGVWKDTWVVGPTAPAGLVKVYVVGIDKSYLRGQEIVTFEVAKPSGRCA